MCSGGIDLTENTTEDIILPKFRLTINVQDPSGSAVPNSIVRNFGYPSQFISGSRTWSGTARGNESGTGTDGSVTYILPPTVPSSDNVINLTVQPPAGSGFAASTITGVELAQDRTITIVLVPVDSSPPTITPTVTGPLGNNGWYVGDVNVSWDVRDPDSDVTSTDGCDVTNITVDAVGTTPTCTATSAGGTASESVTIKRDATAPEIAASRSPGANANGWNNTDVMVSYLATDELSGVDADASDLGDDVLSGEGAGQSASGTAVDLADNTATAAVEDINIDKTAPELAASRSPVANANGHLLMRPNPPAGTDARPRGARTAVGAVIELDWEGNLVWAYRNPMVHHDFQRLANGNTLVLVFEEIPSDLATQVKGGIVDEDAAEPMLGDVVHEVTPAGNTVDSWRSWEHLNVDEDVICFLENRYEWTHQNSLNITASGDLLVSFRQTSTVGIVDRASGKFSWKWGPGEISHQHNPTYLDNGHVLIFDNGPHHVGASFSRVVEVDPRRYI